MHLLKKPNLIHFYLRNQTAFVDFLFILLRSDFYIQLVLRFLLSLGSAVSLCYKKENFSIEFEMFRKVFLLNY